MTDQTALERLLRREQAITAAGLIVLCALAAGYILGGAGMGMSAREMTVLSFFPHKAALAMDGMEMPGMAPGVWSPGVWALTIAMWGAMMVAMMTPSAAPAILLYARVRRSAATRDQGAGVAPTWAFAAAYLGIWLGFSVAAATIQWALQKAGLVSAMTTGSHSKWLSAGVLIAAGLYQLSPLHGVCLSHCRSPASFLTRHWRAGTAGALRLGALHGAYCVGCCWMLMALLFVGGVMNLTWIAALTLLVLAEKLLPGGPWVGRVAGAALIVWGAATLFV